MVFISFRASPTTTMSHGEGWQFIQMGRSIERASATATLLEVYYGQTVRLNAIGEGNEYLEWMGLLRCCTAFEAYCKVYTADLTQTASSNSCCSNKEFPHSVRFSIDSCSGRSMAHPAGERARSRKRSAASLGRLQASLSFCEIAEISGAGRRRVSAEHLAQCRRIHALIYRAYIHYPVQTRSRIESRH